ncbi:MAG: hypothetical protein JNM27_06950 [Leptospirales bacterium]|nr:hypothetical protein [Leptospirales bacterium]
MKGNKRLFATAVAILIIAVAAWFLLTRGKSPDMADMDGQGHSDYMLMLNTGTKYKVGQPNTLEFMIHDKNGKVVRDFETMHTRIMHFIIVRKDLANFQHLHPSFDKESGVFTLTGLQFETDGEYRLFADFTPSGGMAQGHEHHQEMSKGQTLGVSVVAGDANKYRPESIGYSRMSDSRENYSFALQSKGSELERVLRFTVSESGKPVKDLQPYLGALGHVVVLSEGDLMYVHAHPDESVGNETGSVSFEVHFPRPAKYKIFAQFQHKGKILTSSFVLETK